MGTPTEETVELERLLPAAGPGEVIEPRNQVPCDDRHVERMELEPASEQLIERLLRAADRRPFAARQPGIVAAEAGDVRLADRDHVVRRRQTEPRGDRLAP